MLGATKCQVDHIRSIRLVIAFQERIELKSLIPFWSISLAFLTLQL